MSAAKDFLDSIAAATFSNEAEVETRLVEPLLAALGYTAEDIRPKYPVIFQRGKKGRPNEADYAVFYENAYDRNHSLIVVEAKKPTEQLKSGQGQGESYAANLRAPFLLMTNGIDLQIWQTQISADSNLVFEAPIKSLAGKWDALEALISKPAAQNFKESIWRTAASDINRDLSPYIDAELVRTQSYGSAINRQVYSFAGGNDQTLMSDTLLNEVETGAVIVAPSGFGKTTLAMLLFRQALSEASASTPQHLVLEVNLAEAQISGQSIVEFSCDRVASHCPQIVPGALRQILRSTGALLILDGYDRLSPESRDVYLTQMKTLCRDYPALQIFVLSRVSARPAIDFPIFELREYSESERRAYITAQLTPRGMHPSIASTAVPETLQSMFAIPLLFHLAFQYWLERKAYPQDLDGLFRSWLEALFSAGKLSASRKIDAELALRLFARNSVKGVMPAAKVAPLFKGAGLPDGILDDLVQCDALRVEGRSVELVHETLGDYLHACDIAEGDNKKLPDVLRTVALPSDSMLPVLLCSILKNRDHLNIVLARLATTDLPTYFDALRYRANNSDQLIVTKDTFAAAYIEDLLDGIEQPLNGLFDQLAPMVVHSLTDKPALRMAIHGGGTPHWIDYQFLPLTDTPRVTLGPFIEGVRPRGSNLRLLGLRADSGRLLGASILEEKLTLLTKNAALNGGLEWRSERLLGWMQFLIHVKKLPVSLDDSLEDIQVELAKHSGFRIATGNFTPGRQVAIDLLLEDIQKLRERGDTQLNVWWKGFGQADRDLLANEGDTRGLFDLFYRRLQLIYKDVVEQNFSKVSHMFGFYTSMPVRWDIVMPPHRDGLGKPSARSRWLPVRTWDEAGADFAIVSEEPERFRNLDLVPVQDALRKMGRLTKFTHIWAVSGVAPRFDGQSMFGGYDGQTIVMQEVCDYIKDDIKRLFDKCPGGDIPHWEIDRDSPWDIAGGG